MAMRPSLQGADTLYLPLPSADVLVNVARYDEITTCALPNAFFAGEDSAYAYSRPGVWTRAA